MKKKLISSVIAISILCGTSYTAIAAPTSEQQKIIQENRDKYTDIQKKIDDLTSKVDALGAEIEPVVGKVYEIEQKVSKVKTEIEDTKKEIEKAKEELAKQEKRFGDRMRAIYKSGGQGSFLGVMLSSSSVGDFINKAQALTKIMSLDKESVDTIKQKKADFDEKVNSLKSSQDELEKLNVENKAKLDELNVKKDEQQKVVDELNAEKKKINIDLTESEKVLIEYPVSIINSSSSSIDDLKNAINMLKSARGQLVSTDVDKDAAAAIQKAIDRIDEAKKAAAAQQTASTPNRGTSKSSGGAVARPSGGNGSASSVLNYAYQFLGRPYVWGATGPSSFDCSGFTSYVFNHMGYGIGRDTGAQTGNGRAVSQGELQPGDLVFTNGGGHVGIYVGGGQMIHAPRTGDVVKVGPIYGYSYARRIL